MNTLSTTGFPFTFSEMVSEAAMELPPLTRNEDFEFLRLMTEGLMQVFWENYLALLPPEAQEEYEAALDADTADGILTWMAAHADFKDNPDAQNRGQKILEDLSLKLPAVLRREFDSYRAQMSAA